MKQALESEMLTSKMSQIRDFLNGDLKVRAPSQTQQVEALPENQEAQYEKSILRMLSGGADFGQLNQRLIPALSDGERHTSKEIQEI